MKSFVEHLHFFHRKKLFYKVSLIHFSISSLNLNIHILVVDITTISSFLLQIFLWLGKDYLISWCFNDPLFRFETSSSLLLIVKLLCFYNFPKRMKISNRKKKETKKKRKDKKERKERKKKTERKLFQEKFTGFSFLFFFTKKKKKLSPLKRINFIFRTLN